MSSCQQLTRVWSCRYLLHLPGQAYSSRLKNLLLCKSMVIFPDDGNHEFWYHLLEVTVSASQQSAFERVRNPT